MNLLVSSCMTVAYSTLNFGRSTPFRVRRSTIFSVSSTRSSALYIFSSCRTSSSWYSSISLAILSW